jgi:hypothetical protein
LADINTISEWRQSRLKPPVKVRAPERFARGMTCAALKPQAERLLDSLND